MELELKYEVDKDYTKNLENLGFIYKKEKHQIDTYYYIQKDKIYLRIREDLKSDKCSFDFHEVISDLETKETEINLSKEEADKMAYALKGLGYKEVCIIDKKRKVFQKEEIEIVLDDVKDLGSFLEIEIVKEKGSAEDIKHLKEIAQSLGLNDTALRPGGYPDFLMQIQN